MWIATVANIDWPQTAGLSASAQQQQLTQLLDIAQQTGINAVILQVRAAGDALYPSSIEPWAKALMGAQGVDPGYDPLQFAIDEARHEMWGLGAWFNPFRAANLSDTAALAATHFARQRPELTRVHCTQLWFDPRRTRGAGPCHRRHPRRRPPLRDRRGPHRRFLLSVSQRHLPGLDFADSATYARYVNAGGLLARADWRRDNVNRFVQRVYAEVHDAESAVRFGVSPFGIWRPGNPAGITGLDAYATIYADSRHWLQAAGWTTSHRSSTGPSPPPARAPALLGWWRQQNALRRHFWPGLASYRTADGTGSAFANGEIPAQVTLARAQAIETGGATGTILYNASSVRSDRGGFATALATGLYAEPAIPPATTWLDAVAPAEPTSATVTGTPGALAIPPAGVPDAYWWLVRWRANGQWGQRLVRANVPSIALNAMEVDGIVVDAIGNEVGNASPPVVWRPSRSGASAARQRGRCPHLRADIRRHGVRLRRDLLQRLPVEQPHQQRRGERIPRAHAVHHRRQRRQRLHLGARRAHQRAALRARQHREPQRELVHERAEQLRLEPAPSAQSRATTGSSSALSFTAFASVSEVLITSES